MPPLSTATILNRGLKLIGMSRAKRERWSDESLVQSFIDHFGSAPRVLKKIFIALQDTNNEAAKVPAEYLNLKYFLMAMYFLTLYPKEKEIKVKWCCRQTFENWVWCYISKVQALKEEKIVWPEHWSDPNNPFVPYFLFSVDGTHCAVFERQTTVMNRDEKYFSHKFSSAGVMHEVAIDVYHSRIVHIRGPFPAGRHDKAVFMEELMGIIPAASKGIADNGYRSKEDMMEAYLAFPNSCAPRVLRKFLQRSRSRHESLYSRMKNFEVLNQRFRSKHADRDIRHKACFEAVAVTLQFQMENGSPLMSVD